MRIHQLAPKVHALEAADDCAEWNRELLHAYERHAGDESLHRSHFFGGRYENVYIGSEKIPALNIVLDRVREAARELLYPGLPADTLQAGCWFNAMAPGQATQPHVHDDYDEILSAVYYVTAPENSGDLILHLPDGQMNIPPRAGRMVLFPPDMLHEVGVNRSDEARLSIGINVGAPAECEYGVCE